MITEKFSNDSQGDSLDSWVILIVILMIMILKWFLSDSWVIFSDSRVILKWVLDDSFVII